MAKQEETYYLHDSDCERVVLGTLLIERDAIHQAREYLSSDIFFEKKHSEIYCAISAVADRGDRADIISVLAECRKQGNEIMPYELADIAGCSTFDLMQHVCRLADLHKRRMFRDLGNLLISYSSNESEDIADVLADVSTKLNDIQGEATNHIRTAQEYLEKVYKQVSDNINGTSISGTPTGFRMIDERGGFKPTNLIILAAESSQGKTSLANYITLNAAESGAPIAFYSMEMSGEQLMMRLAAMKSGVECTTLDNAPLSTEQMKCFDVAIGKLEHLPIFFDDRSSSNLDTIVSSIRSMKIKYEIKGVVIDYLQILSINKKSASNEETLAEAARKFKNLAKELGVWILCLSQLNRNIDNPIPSVSRLRGSGQINEAADVTMLLYRPEVYGRNMRYPEPFENTDTRATAMIDVAKGRNIGTFKFICGFDAPTTRFFELESRPLLAFQPTETEPF